MSCGCRPAALGVVTGQGRFTMKASLSIIAIQIFYLPALFCQGAIINKAVSLNEAVDMPCPCTENASFERISPTTVSIGECKQSRCEVKPEFKNRFEIGVADSGNFFLNVSRVAYNDDGTYACTCDGEQHEVKLSVLVPQRLRVTKGDNITLPCFMRDNNKKDMIWRANKETVLQYTYANESFTVKETLRDRFMLNRGEFERGNYSLQIKVVRKTDEGLYQCFFDDEYYRGSPDAVELRVDDQHPQPSRVDCHIWTCIGYGCGCGVMVIIAIIFMYAKFKSRLKCHQRKTINPPQSFRDLSAPVQEQSLINHDATQKSSTLPIQD